jgi:hypothetical protein
VAGQWLRAQYDSTTWSADRDRHEPSAAHHHPFEDCLATVEGSFRITHRFSAPTQNAGQATAKMGRVSTRPIARLPRLFLDLLVESSPEALNLATRVHETLLASKERVAVRA